jgi:hypothetical protein
MRTFNDNAGRTWTLAINVDAVRRVRSIVNVDLLEAVEGKLIEKLVEGEPHVESHSFRFLVAERCVCRLTCARVAASVGQRHRVKDAVAVVLVDQIGDRVHVLVS